MNRKRILGRVLTVVALSSFKPERIDASITYERMGDMEWEECVQACDEKGMQIADIFSSDENKEAKKACGDHSNCWLGLQDKDEEGTFIWTSTNLPVACYTNWESGEPSGLENSKDCVQMNYQGNSLFPIHDQKWYETGCGKQSRCLCVQRTSPGSCTSKPDKANEALSKLRLVAIVLLIVCPFSCIAYCVVLAYRRAARKPGHDRIVTAHAELVALPGATPIAVAVSDGSGNTELARPDSESESESYASQAATPRAKPFLFIPPSRVPPEGRSDLRL